MAVVLADSKILFGVTGSIAAFKAAGWVSSLCKEGADVTVVMTEAATRFVSPLTFAAITGNKVYSKMFDAQNSEQIPHITLARQKDLILVAPATAHTIARLAHGLADDLLSVIILATAAPVLICPAMNSQMYNNKATQINISRLKEFGYKIMEPDSGLMACGEDGPGRLPEWDQAKEMICANLYPQDLKGQTVVVTAGPTQEALDPTRFLSNRSSGRMGYAMAITAKRRGAEVSLISGPTFLLPPPGIEVIHVTSAAEMGDTVLSKYEQATIIVKAAAVADFRPEETSDHKIKKDDASLTLALKSNIDILKELGRRKKTGNHGPLLIGFAAESRDHLSAGRKKLEEKNLDLIAVNDILADDSGFEALTNRVTIIDRKGFSESLPLLAKEEVADRIWDRIIVLMNEDAKGMNGED